MKIGIIVGAADVESKMLKDLAVQKESLVIAADGGYDYLKLLSISPDFIIGDGDSIKEKCFHSSLIITCNNSEEMEQKLQLTKQERKHFSNQEPVLLSLPTRKDDTDLLAAIRAGILLGCKEFHLFGVFGGQRLDHSFASMQCLIFLHKQGLCGYLYHKGVVTTIAEQERLLFSAEIKGYFSVFALTNQVENVTLKGLAYEVEDYTFTNDYPIGVSNEFLGKEASVTVGKGMLLVVYPYEGCKGFGRTVWEDTKEEMN